jgi:oxygen-dependent protoporphyrinogen oxidase
VERGDGGVPTPASSHPIPTVVVVGGGITGLATAWALATAGTDLRVEVLEADRRFGGKLLAVVMGGRAVDVGPDAFVARRPEAVELCRQLGLADELVAPGTRTASVWARGRLRTLPAGLALGVPTRLGPLARSGILSPLGMGRAALDLSGWPPRWSPKPRPDRAVGDIVGPRLGRQVADRLADPLIGGIHAGPTAGLSAAAVFPALLEAAERRGSLMRAMRDAQPTAMPGGLGPVGVGTGGPRRKGRRVGAGTAGSSDGGGDPPVFLTVRGGLARLADHLVGELRALGVELRASTPVDRIEVVPGDARWALHTPAGVVPAHGVVVTTPAPSAARLLRTVDGALADVLAGIGYADVALVTMRLAERDVSSPPEGTGFLVPATSG